MRVATCGWLLVCLGAAGPAYAQVPTDPLAGHLPGNEAAQRQPAAPSGATQLPPPYVTRQSDVEIPFSVKAGATADAQPAAVRVFVSWDRGTTWHFYDERRAEEGRFRFRPRQDGEYWFATQTIDRAGRPDSPEPRTPQLRLIVDTQRPQLLVQAQVDDAGSVRVAWSATDASLAPATLKVEYQDAADTGGTWLPVELKSPAEAPAEQVNGQTTFRPKVSSRAINLRAEIADVAGNVAYHSQRLPLDPPPRGTAGDGLGAADPSATRWKPDEAGSPVNGISAASQTPLQNAPPPPAQGASEQVQIPNLVSNPFAPAGRLASRQPQIAVESLPAPGTAPDGFAPRQGSGALGPAPTENTLPAVGRPGYSASPTSPYGDAASSAGTAPAFDELPPQPARPSIESIYGGDPAVGPAPQPAYAPPGVRDEPDQGLSFGDRVGPEIMPTPAPTPTESIDPPHGQRPRLTNSRRFSLEYDVESVGPEGVQAVELWGTTDGGRTWVKWGTDPDRISPFDVEVNSEAIYGFRIVIVGRNGLATSSPQPGDAADIWVAIDLTRPNARLTGAAYGQGPAAGKLDIRWEASDANLGSRPVTLLASDRPDGAFTPLAAGLPNTGQYLWEFDPRSPRQVYLRLEVRDDAGNVAIDQLTEPIRVEGLEPKARIRGFQPAGPGPETIRGAFRSPLFR